MKRRAFLAGSGATLALPAIARAEGTRVLKFIPQSDVTSLDPIRSSAYITRNHGYVVFDTLYGQDSKYNASPQMVEGHVVEDGGRMWQLTLRDGQKFHDGTPVLARDCVASIRRWGKRDPFGQALLAATDELSAPSDRVIRFRLNRPFALLPDALGKSPALMPAMMPERLAQTDAFTQVTEVVGSGLYRYLARERVSGARVAYERFADYIPRNDGAVDGTAGPKIAHFDRIEWTVIPDASTAANAMLSGEQDWWVFSGPDLLPMLQKSGKMEIAPMDASGSMGIMRMNQLQPPFNNAAIRRALLGAVNQSDFMIATVTEDQSYWHVPAGFWTPGSPLASDVGMAAIKAKPDYDSVKRDLKAAGYNGEKVVLLAPTDIQVLKAMADVGADMLTKSGMNVDYQALDWGSVNARLTKKDPIEKGGWSCFFVAPSGSDMINPAGDVALRSNGADAWVGWPDSPALEALRTDWLNATDAATQIKIGQDIQRQAFVDVPFIPLGQYWLQTVYNAQLTGVVTGDFPVFWNVRRT